MPLDQPFYIGQPVRIKRRVVVRYDENLDPLPDVEVLHNRETIVTRVDSGTQVDKYGEPVYWYLIETPHGLFLPDELEPI